MQLDDWEGSFLVLVICWSGTLVMPSSNINSFLPQQPEQSQKPEQSRKTEHQPEQSQQSEQSQTSEQPQEHAAT